MLAKIVLNASTTAAPGASFEISSAAELVRPTSRPLGPNGFTQLINVFSVERSGVGKRIPDSGPRHREKHDVSEANHIPSRTPPRMRSKLSLKSPELLRPSRVIEHYVVAVPCPEPP